MTTDMHVETGLEALNKGNLALARESFELACQKEESEGKNPEENPEISYLLQNILIVQSLTVMEEAQPEAFQRIKTLVSKNTHGIPIP